MCRNKENKMKIKPLIPFGENFIDGSIVGWISVTTERSVVPAPGHKKGDSDMYVAVAALDFRNATTMYQSLGYETSDAAFEVARALRDVIGCEYFVEINNEVWVRAAMVKSVTSDRIKTQLWMDFQATTPSVDIVRNRADSPAMSSIIEGIYQAQRSTAEIEGDSISNC
jgi:hypothetical protein